jgi:hypothetical protein
VEGNKRALVACLASPDDSVKAPGEGSVPAGIEDGRWPDLCSFTVKGDNFYKAMIGLRTFNVTDRISLCLPLDEGTS